MAVVFDEVVTQVEVAPPQRPPQPAPGDQPQPPPNMLHCWQVQRAIVRRRQQRLEAD